MVRMAAAELDDLDFHTRIPEWYTFLQRAFFPQRSPKKTPERFDVALASDHFNEVHLAKKAQQRASGGSNDSPLPLRVLDLGAGDCLFLDRLEKKHRGSGQEASHFDVRIEYVAADLHLREGSSDWLAIQRRQRCPQCFTEPRLHTVDLENLDNVSAVLQGRSFDLVIMMNVMHEIAPARIPRLLSTIRDHLSPDGRLWIVDPDSRWALDTASFWSPLDAYTSEWEIDSTWYQLEDVEALLTPVGFDSGSDNHERLGGNTWSVIAAANGNAVDLNTAMKTMGTVHERRANVLLQQYKKRVDALKNSLKGGIGDQDFTTIRSDWFHLAAVACTYCRHILAMTEINDAQGGLE